MQREREREITEISNIKENVSVQWQAQCHSKWQWHSVSATCKTQTHVARSTDSPSSVIITEPYCDRFESFRRKKTVYNFSYLPFWNWFFECRIVVLRLLRLNIKARKDIPEFLNANLSSIHLIAFDIDLSWNIFYITQFLVIPHGAAALSSSLTSKSENWELEI